MKRLVMLLFLITFLSLASAAAIDDSIPIQIQTTDSSGNIVTGTFSFMINISNSANCDSILYSNTTTMTTDSRGIVTYNLENVNLAFDEQYYFCYYRDGVLKQNLKIGRTAYAFNSKYLGGYTENFFAPLNTSLNGNFTISGSLFINGIDALNGSSEDTVPLNTIIFYNGTSCPQGYSELTAAQGRYLVGFNTSNGTLGGQVGTALLGEENRAVGEHTHPITDSFRDSRGSSSGSNYRLTSSGGTFVTGDPDNVLQISAANAGSVAGTNAPYVQYLTCIKTATVDLTQGWNQDATSIWTADSTLKVGIGTTTPTHTLNVVGDINVTGNNYGFFPSGMVSFFKLTSCPTGWTQDSTATGRYILGTNSSYTQNATVGTALSDSENRAVGEHNHDITDPGHAHRPQARNNANSPPTVTYGTQQLGFSGSGGTGGDTQADTDTRTTGVTINNAGSVAGTNAPYIQYLVCVKD